MTAIAYAASFLALAALTGWAATSLPRWALRLPLLVATPLLALAVWWALSQRDGWPTTSRPADGAAFVAGVIQPPTPSSSGAIYLWLTPPNRTTPRGYRLPYSRQLEQQLAQAAQAQKHGQRVAVRTAKHPGHAHGQRLSQQLLRFYRLPPPGLQRKEHQ